MWPPPVMPSGACLRSGITDRLPRSAGVLPRERRLVNDTGRRCRPGPVFDLHVKLQGRVGLCGQRSFVFHPRHASNCEHEQQRYDTGKCRADWSESRMEEWMMRSMMNSELRRTLSRAVVAAASGMAVLGAVIPASMTAVASAAPKVPVALDSPNNPDDPACATEGWNPACWGGMYDQSPDDGIPGDNAADGRHPRPRDGAERRRVDEPSRHTWSHLVPKRRPRSTHAKRRGALQMA